MGRHSRYHERAAKSALYREAVAQRANKRDRIGEDSLRSPGKGSGKKGKGRGGARTGKKSPRGRQSTRRPGPGSRRRSGPESPNVRSRTTRARKGSKWGKDSKRNRKMSATAPARGGGGGGRKKKAVSGARASARADKTALLVPTVWDMRDTYSEKYEIVDPKNPNGEEGQQQGGDGGSATGADGNDADDEKDGDGDRDSDDGAPGAGAGGAPFRPGGSHHGAAEILALKFDQLDLAARARAERAQSLGLTGEAAAALHMGVPVEISRSIFTHWGSEWGHRRSQTLSSSDQIAAPLY